SSFTVESDTEITATVSATTSGPVTVTSPTGTSTSTIAYTYASTPLATITSFTPASAFPLAVITITGTTLGTVNSATFTGAGGTRVAATFIQVDADTQVRLGIP